MVTTIQQATLSDGLAALIAAIEPTQKTGLVMTRANVGVLLEGLHAMRDEARHLEIIADRAQWNERARRDAQRNRRAAIDAGVADGVVEILPVAPRLQASSPDGGAA